MTAQTAASTDVSIDFDFTMPASYLQKGIHNTAWQYEGQKSKTEEMAQGSEVMHIVRKPNFLGGKPAIAGHGITVHHIAVRNNQGYTPTQIVTDLFPSLSLAQVHAALLYYQEHKEEIDREIAEEVERFKNLATEDSSPLAQRVGKLLIE